MRHAEHALVGQLRDALAEAADPARAGPMQAYMKSAMPCRGVPAPRLKALLRPLLGEGEQLDEVAWRAILRELWDAAAFREERYAATALLRHPRYREHRIQPQTLDLCEHLVRTGAWWDHVDEISHVVGEILLARPEQVRAVVAGWAESDDLWVRRSAIICQVGHGDRLDQHLLALAIEANLDGSTRTTPALSAYGREFFVRKAIGWALRDHARVDPRWVRAFVDVHRRELSGLSCREAVRRLDPTVPDVRRATPADVPAVRALVDAAYAPYVERMGRKPAPMTADHEAEVREAEVWVATTRTGIVGVIVLRARPEAQPDHLLVEDVAVAEVVRGSGLGVRLLALAEERARVLGLAEVRLYTHVTMTENLAYYPRRGYVETGRTETDGFRRVHFSKRLPASAQP